jgi:hypothetical protein
MGLLDEARRRFDLEESRNGHVEAVDRVVLPKISADQVATIDDLAAHGASVRWLWERWIPSGVLTAIAGLAGIGKTRLCADLVRRLRHRMKWPDDSPCPTDINPLTLWVVADNHHDQLVSLADTFGIREAIRLNAPKSDPYAGVTLEAPDDYGALEARIKAVQPSLVIVDTVGNATDKNLSRQEDAKAFYQPLQLIARRHRTAILCLTHLNASGQFLGRRVLEKVRVAIRIEQPDGQNRLRIEVAKTFSQKPPALGAVMHDSGFDFDNNPPARTEASLTPGLTQTKLQEAADWLHDFLCGGPKRIKDARDKAELKGFGTGVLYRAKAALDVSEYFAENSKWWRLTSDDELK